MMLKRTLRIKYAKIGMIRFIGHLDITRLMTRAIARSSIPAIYSQGFSPHMKASFGPSLPLGITSECEYLDVAVNDAETMKTVKALKEELQGYMPEGITISETELLEEGAPSLAEIANRARYEILIPEEFEPPNGKLACFLQMEKVEVEKASKKGISTVDIRPSVESFNRIDTCESGAKVVTYELVTVIGQAAYATPALVLKFLLGCDWQDVPGLRIHRKELYSTTSAR